MKKKIVLFGNCQIEPIYKMLASIKTVSNIYELEHFTPIHCISIDETIKLHNAVKKCDILITQPIAPTYRPELNSGTSALKTYLRANSRCILVPSFYWDGYSPDNFYFRNLDNSHIPSLPQNIIVFMSYILGKNINETIDELDKEVSLDKYAEYALAGIEELKRREEHLDAKISPYILKHYRQSKLFYDPMHPCDKLLWHCVSQLLRILDCNTLVNSLIVKVKIYFNNAKNDFFYSHQLSITPRVYISGKFTFKKSSSLDRTKRAEHIEWCFNFYKEHENLLEHNKKLIEPVWRMLSNEKSKEN